MKQIKVVKLLATDSYVRDRMQGEGNSHPWHENCGRSKFLLTFNLLQCTWTVYAVIPFPSALPSCLSVDPKITTSERNSLTKEVRVLSQLWSSPLWNTTHHSPYFEINCLPVFCSRFQMGDRSWFSIIMFCLCFVLANNRLVGTFERTCYCFRESERDATAVLSDLNNISSNFWWSGSKTGSWR